MRMARCLRPQSMTPALKHHRWKGGGGAGVEAGQGECWLSNLCWLPSGDFLFPESWVKRKRTTNHSGRIQPHQIQWRLRRRRRRVSCTTQWRRRGRRRRRVVAETKFRLAGPLVLRRGAFNLEQVSPILNLSRNISLKCLPSQFPLHHSSTHLSPPVSKLLSFARCLPQTGCFVGVANVGEMSSLS